MRLGTEGAILGCAASTNRSGRTPMHGMLTACSLLMDTGLGAEQGELAHIIRESGAILLQVMYVQALRFRPS